ncbi:hypothetical protein ACS0TY_026764 [Phlomoides rotata]
MSISSGDFDPLDSSWGGVNQLLFLFRAEEMSINSRDFDPLGSSWGGVNQL